MKHAQLLSWSKVQCPAASPFQFLHIFLVVIEAQNIISNYVVDLRQHSIHSIAV